MRPCSSARLWLLCLAAAVAGCSTPDAQPRPAPAGAVQAPAAQQPAMPNTAERPASGRGGGRIAPPAAITCDPNHLTAWFGVVSGYRRDSKQTWLRISTDYDTVEQTTLDHAGAADASAHYLLWGAPFAAKDWPSIEQSPGRLIKDVRAVVWVCDDGKTAPVVDWQPARE